MFNKKDAGYKDGFDTLIGVNSVFEGNIECQGTIRVDGKVKGDLRVNGDVYIGTNATITGNISADNVHLSGTVEGNIRSTGILRILSTAKLFGDIEVKNFVTDEGAVFHGKCSMLEIAESTDDTIPENSPPKKSRSNRDYKKSSVLDQVYEDKEKNNELSLEDE